MLEQSDIPLFLHKWSYLDVDLKKVLFVTRRNDV